MKTLEIKDEISDEEIIRETIQFLIRQAKPSVDGRTCLYRNRKAKTACAVGAWIPDCAKKALSFRGNVKDLALLMSSPRMEKRYPKIVAFLNNNTDLLLTLQRIHDHLLNFRSVETFKKSLNASFSAKMLGIQEMEFDYSEWGVGNE